jgi:hypothetical protein
VQEHSSTHARAKRSEPWRLADADGNVSVLVANLVPEAQDIVLAGLPTGQTRVRHLDLDSARVRAETIPVDMVGRGRLRARAGAATPPCPYAVARNDVQRPR